MTIRKQSDRFRALKKRVERENFDRRIQDEIAEANRLQREYGISRDDALRIAATPPGRSSS